MNKQQKKIVPNKCPLPGPKSLKGKQTFMRIGMQNKIKKSYSWFFSSKNIMYRVLGTLLSSLISTSAVKTRKV